MAEVLPIYFIHVQSALQWVVDYANIYNIASVNMSFGAGNYNSAVQPAEYLIYDELEELVHDGVIVVSASGNSFHSYGDTQGVAYPAADPNSLSVGAVYDEDLGRRPPTGTYADGSAAYTTDADRITSYSQRHETLTTVLAPGELITAAWLNGGTNTIGGTSMAAPHIAGIAVLAQQLAMQELGEMLTQEQFASVLQSTGTTVNDGDDEDDNVDNTGLDFARVDMFALAEGILDLHWEIDANDDPAPGDQKDDGNPDLFEISRVDDTLEVQINGNALPARSLDEVVRITITGSSDTDTFKVYSLGSDFTGNVVINAAGDGDVAQLWDSAGEDTFKGYPTVATFAMEDAYLVTANDVRYVHAYGTMGDEDLALLYDQDGTDETFEAYPDWARLYNDSFYNRCKSFRYVHAYATTGDGDVAYLHDDDLTQDTFEAWPDVARLYNDSFYNRCKSFGEVHAYGTTGGTDMAKLYDSMGNDTFDGYPEMARLYGDGFYNRVKSFREVHAYSENGDDEAHLYDSSGNDTFQAKPEFDYARMYDTLPGSGPGFFNRVKSFENVYAYSQNGGEDWAYLYDSAGADELTADPNEAFLTVAAGYTNTITAQSFRHVHAYAEVGSGGTDTACLYDSAGDDYLEARDGDPQEEDWGQLGDAADAVFDLWVRGFDGIDDIDADSGSGDYDTTDLDPEEDLDFDLFLTGSWEN